LPCLLQLPALQEPIAGHATTSSSPGFLNRGLLRWRLWRDSQQPDAAAGGIENKERRVRVPSRSGVFPTAVSIMRGSATH